MATKKTPTLKLIMQTLRSPYNHDLYKELKCRASEVTEDIFAKLEKNEGFASAYGTSMIWYCRVISLLAPIPKANKEFFERCARERETEAAEIGKMFLVLCEDLPSHLRDLREVFTELPIVAPEYAVHLLKQSDSQAAGTCATALAIKGMTPLTIFYAIEAIHLLFSRCMRHGYLDRDEVTISDTEILLQEGISSKELGTSLCIAEIGAMTEQNEKIAGALYRWIFEVARFKPFIFKGFRVIRNEADQPIIRSCETIWRLRDRWSATTSMPEKREFYELVAETLLTPGDYESLEELRSRKSEITGEVIPGMPPAKANNTPGRAKLADKFGDQLPREWFLTVYSAILPPKEADEMTQAFVAYLA